MSDVTLLSSIDDGVVDGNGFRTIKITGEPYMAAMTSAIIANYERVTGRPRPGLEVLEALVGTKVTLIITGENAFGSGIAIAREGKLFIGASGGLAILPKGARSKGYRVDPAKVLDVFAGYSAELAAETVALVRAQYPQLRNLTQERLEQLPRDSDVCSLAVFGSNPMWGAPDCLWLIGEYWPEDDICDTNVLLIRPEFGTSESGSCYGRDLLRNQALGEVIGFEPIPFSQAIELCNDDFDYALAHVFHLPFLYSQAH